MNGHKPLWISGAENLAESTDIAWVEFVTKSNAPARTDPWILQMTGLWSLLREKLISSAPSILGILESSLARLKSAPAQNISPSAPRTMTLISLSCFAYASI